MSEVLILIIISFEVRRFVKNLKMILENYVKTFVIYINVS